MTVQTANKYINLLEDYMDKILKGKSDMHKKNILSYFYPDREYLVDAGYCHWQFEKVLRCLEDEELYEDCITVLKLVTRLERMKNKGIKIKI
ncbi:hypothetical protein [Pedobacter sp. MR2016-24]|uniref:hypothetical protein n=1 Tax=Pedobacter sp. MR2016-24 TaxID=2994466 RepID=UPI002247667C|nr:hypothetical protein [Pedobacter sp. MR2016-24]MCX2486590.1 hypothetical protein [Pedobacter sp. MR2016-24]